MNTTFGRYLSDEIVKELLETVGGQILISQSTKSFIKEPLTIAKEFEVLPKGIQTPIILSEITGINGKYNYQCPKREISVKRLSNPIEIVFHEIFEKHVGKTAIKGKIISASKSHAIIISERGLKVFDNLEIRGETSVFCKVIEKLDEGYQDFYNEKKILIRMPADIHLRDEINRRTRERRMSKRRMQKGM